MTAIAGRGRARVIGVTWIQITATHDAMPRVTESHRECARAGRTDKRCVVSVPRVAAVSGAEDSRYRRAAGRNPGIHPALGCDAGAAGCKRRFTLQGRRHSPADVLPGLAIGGAEIGKLSVHRVAVRDTALRCPERETIVERARILILKLHRPARAAVYCFINAKVCGIVPDRLQIGDLFAHPLHIAELQRLGPGNHRSFPRRSAVGSQKKSAAATGCPYHARVYRTDCNQSLRGSAVLRHKGVRMTFVLPS